MTECDELFNFNFFISSEWHIQYFFTPTLIKCVCSRSVWSNKSLEFRANISETRLGNQPQELFLIIARRIGCPTGMLPRPGGQGRGTCKGFTRCLDERGATMIGYA